MKTLMLIFSLMVYSIAVNAQAYNRQPGGVVSQQPTMGNTTPLRPMDNTNNTTSQQQVTNTNPRSSEQYIQMGQVSTQPKANQGVNTAFPATAAEAVNGAGNSNMNINSLPSNGQNDNNGTSSNTLNTSTTNYNR